MKSFGGFLGLESTEEGGGGIFPHAGAIALSCGRACLRQILLYRRPTKIFIPYFICDSVIEPIERLGIKYQFYPINESFLPAVDFEVSASEMILIVHYFGVHSMRVAKCVEKYSGSVIFDRTQAFFVHGDGQEWSFNSARKFFGVPDGAYLSGPFTFPQPSQRLNSSIDYLTMRAQGLDALAYKKYLQHEKEMTSDVLGPSEVTESLLKQINYESTAIRRRQNFAVYDQILGNKNQMDLKMEDEDVPFCYPLLISFDLSKEKLIQKKIFIPTFWRECLKRDVIGFEWERSLVHRLFPLPIDQRYSTMEVKMVAQMIFEEIK